MPSNPPAYVGDPPRVLPGEASEQFIDRQLRKTRWQVKVVDLSVALAQFAASLLGAMLVLIVVDHWVFGLGSWGRLLSFGGLLVMAVWFVAKAILPLVIRPISPFYAARAIETSTPGLKNSLINFLFFRAQPASVQPGVYEALQDRAAFDLRRVPVESAVDRGRLIRVGYVLAAVFTSCAAYAVLSPKDAFQTVRRVSAPWADIARPSRVSIEDVKPGDSDVYQGQQVLITAAVRGMGAGEQASLVFTTADAQSVEQPIAMKLDGSGLRHEVLLPPAGPGIQQDIEYRIRAGDAVTNAFRLRVSPAPMIRIERIEYRYPAYMKRTADSVPTEGAIKAPEGTRVTVHAQANYPMRSAYVQFTEVPSGSSAAPTTRRIPMDVQGTAAQATWVLELQADRRTPQYVSYELNFTSDKGQQADKPVQYPIEVLPDFAPEVEILSPEKERTDIAEDSSEKIEIRAVDPDFGLTAIRLRGVSGGVEILKEDLLQQAEGRTGQSLADYVLQPRKLGLSAGAEVSVWAIAEDNRVAPGSETPAPNVSRTRNYHFRVVAAPRGRVPDAPDEPSAKKQETDGASQDGQSGEAGDQNSPGQSGTASNETGGAQQESGSGGGSTQQGGSDTESVPMEESSGEGTGSGKPDSSANPQADPKSNSAAGEGSQSGAAKAGGEQKPSGGEGTQDAPREEPLHDGEVFEKTLEHMKSAGEKTAKPSEKPSDGQSSEQNSSGQNAQTPQKTDSAQSAEKTPRQSEGNSAAQSPANQSPPSAADAPPTPSSTDGQSAEEKKSGGMQGSQAKKTPASPKDGSSQSDEAAGAGQESPKQETSKSDQPTADRAKPPDGGNHGTPAPNPSPESQSKRPSDSAGKSTGDRSGSGDQGAGQSARQPQGNSPGSTSANDAGAGAADEQGPGETSQSPGNSNVGSKPSGQPGSEKGEGSSSDSKDGSNSSNPSAQPSTAKQPGETPDKSPASASAGDRSNGSEGVPTGGGLPGGSQASRNDAGGEVPDSDEANLEYARKATDLVLEYLSNQQSRPDEKLMNELGWTAEDLKNFLQRWSELKRSAVSAPEGQRDLDENLRGLGLRPAADRVRRGAATEDDLRGLRESGLRSSPPPQYLEQFDAFKKGTARSAP